MPSPVRNVARLQWLFDIGPTGIEINRRFKVHDLITCESKVQFVVCPRGLVSFVRPKELASFDPWHVTRSPPIGRRI